MMIKTMTNVSIHSIGMYVPERIVSNQFFDELLGSNVSQWLEEYVEIYERRWCAPNESTADLCVSAARVAMERGNVCPKEIDLLIVATDTPEFISPSTASKVQHLLGLERAGTFDLNSACAGFVTALDVATKYIKSDSRYQTVLVIGAYAMSKYLNLLDKKTANLFADGAGAFVLRASQGDNGFIASELRTMGEYHDYMGIYAGGTFRPVDEAVLEGKEHLLKIEKKFPTDINPQTWADMALNLALRSGIELRDFAQFVFTQINIHSIRDTMDRLELSRSFAQTSMHHYGYTGSACIPIAFCEAVDAGKIKRGDAVMLIGSGGGLAFAGLSLRY